MATSLNIKPPSDAAASASQLQTRASLRVAAELPTHLQPRFVRLPKPGTLCPFTGLSRTQIYLLCKEGKVRSHSLKRRGTCRGVRVVEFMSLCAAIESFAADEEQQGANG
jgi:hypothetical protein